jgi:hypothetical protein
MLTFSWAPALGQHGRRGSDHDVSGVDRGDVAVVVLPVHHDAVGPRLQRGDGGPGAQLSPVAPGRGGHRAGDRAHAAHRHPPATRAVADQVVQEAAAGQPVGGVHVGERADQPVGQRDAPDEVVVQVLGDDVGQRPLAQLVPQLPVAQPAGQVVGGR